MRCPQEQAARSTRNGAKTTLSDGVSIRDLQGVGLDDDPKRYTQLLEPSLALRPSIAVYFPNAETCRVSNLRQAREVPLPLDLSFQQELPTACASGRP